MYELGIDERVLLRELFKEGKDTLIWSYLQGYMGNGYVDNKEKPTCGMILYGDFCFVAGDVSSIQADKMLKFIPEGRTPGKMFYIGITEDWDQLFGQIGEFNRIVRYGIKKEGDVFDRKKLEQMMKALPDEYILKQIDEKIYRDCLDMDWSKDFCSNFYSAEDFMNRGLGYVIYCNDEMVAGASSYSAYDEGIEVEIITKEEFRRRGLAKVCGAKLVLECLKRGKYPSWDAANKSSVAIAEKIGYHFDKEYSAWIRK